MSQPLVSILIPCYNAGQWLGAAVESALAQTWANCEIIVVDDGSTDNSLAVALSYEKRGVRVVSQRNVGKATACNVALRLACGEFVKFFDSDDIISSDMIELQVRALERMPTKVAYSEWARFHGDPDAAHFQRRAGWHDAGAVDWLVEVWRDGEPMMQCGQFLIPKSLLERTGGWDERLSLIDDFEFFTRILLASDGVVFTPGAKLYYRSGIPGSLSAQKSAKAWLSAALSTTLGTNYLLAKENSPRTRAAASAMLQILVYEMYPNSSPLVARLERRIVEIGGCELKVQGGKAFLLVSRIVGWKAARWLQIWTGKRPRCAAS